MFIYHSRSVTPDASLHLPLPIASTHATGSNLELSAFNNTSPQSQVPKTTFFVSNCLRSRVRFALLLPLFNGGWPSLLPRQHACDLFICQDNILHMIGSVFEVVRLVIDVGRKE